MNIDKEIDVVVFKGKKYRRYPNGSDRSGREYFKRRVAGGNEYLHRAIYEATYGKIPEGFDVHHVDMNSLNNDITNLVCISHEEHRGIHSKYYHKNNREAVLAHLEEIRPLAKKWQQSKEGKEHYIKIGKISFQNRPFKKYVCSCCGKEYLSKGTKTMYCSNKCYEVIRSRKRREMGLDNVERTCEECGNIFKINKYSKQKCCSKKCSATLRYRSKK